jgi:asparagine synthase (glutamine-hydrolysing)
MCGIFAYLCRDPIQTGFSLKNNINTLYDQFKSTSNRGPDKSVFTTSTVNRNMLLATGFHRLAIRGLSNGDQPFNMDSITLLVNGEIYNSQELIEDHDLAVRSDSDCEVILHLYRKYGIDKTISLLDGVWSFILYDHRLGGKMIFARDMFGVRPLFYGDSTNISRSQSFFSKHHCGNTVDIALGSQLINLQGFVNCTPVQPRMIYTIEFEKDNGFFEMTKRPYIDIMYRKITSRDVLKDMGFCTKLQALEEDNEGRMKTLFKQGVIKRLESEQPIGFLLSGGLDSSLVLATAMHYLHSRENEHKAPDSVHVFTIGTKGESEDITAAVRLVKWLNILYGDCITHHIVDFKNWDEELVSDVIKSIESWDTTTVRASVPMYMLSEYIRENTDVKVIMSGEGADELFGGYLYFHRAPCSKLFEYESRRLLTDLYLFDGLRADRSVSAWGLELRVPFLDKEFSSYVMSLKTGLKRPIDGIEKYILRENHKGVIPDSVLWRQKNGMSDGVGTRYQKWIQDVARKYFSFYYYTGKKSDSELEKQYYQLYFQEHFPDNLGIIPYTWMPKWSDHVGDDPSGLLVLSDNSKNEKS